MQQSNYSFKLSIGPETVISDEPLLTVMCTPEGILLCSIAITVRARWRHEPVSEAQSV